MKKIKTLLAFILIMNGLMIGCSKNPDQPGNEGNPNSNSCEGVNANFTTDILPLVQTRCASDIGCHGNGSTNGPGALTNFTQIKNAAISIKAAVVSRHMPLGSSFNSAQISQISCWVDNGANNN